MTSGDMLGGNLSLQGGGNMGLLDNRRCAVLLILPIMHGGVWYSKKFVSRLIFVCRDALADNLESSLP